jgi:glycosyltransferase involved in cell wall biosynthesis
LKSPVVKHNDNAQPIKVLHLIDSGGLYGAEKMLLSLVQEQKSQGLEPMILSAGEPGINEKSLETEALAKGLPVTPWRMKSGFNLKESWKILKWAQQNKYQLLHSHGFKFNVLLGIFPRWARQIPMVATLHGYVHAPRFSKLWFYERLDRIAIRKMQGIVLVAEAMKKELQGNFPSENVDVIPNGLNISELEKAATVELAEPFKSFVSSHEPVILGVGRLSREKGFDRLIKAFADLKNKHPDSGLVIVGEGALRPQFEVMIDLLNVRDDVLMPGYCDRVPSLLHCSSVLVMPSLTEGLPITLLEAMSLKTPIVASAVGEIPQVLGNGNGGEVLIDVEPRTITEAIDRCVTDENQSNEKVEWAYFMVKGEHSSEAMSTNYLRFYNGTLKGL